LMAKASLMWPISVRCTYNISDLNIGALKTKAVTEKTMNWQLR